MSVVTRFGDAIMTGINAGLDSWRNNLSQLEANPDWDTYDTRLQRYAQLDLYYTNTVYTDANDALAKLKRAGRLYTGIRGIYNPINRFVNVYATKIYPGVIDWTDLTKGAVPLNLPASTYEAVKKILMWSQWDVQKQPYVLTGEKFADSFLKVVEYNWDNPSQYRAVIELLEPQKVRYISFNPVGDVDEIWIQYEVVDNVKPLRPDEQQNQNQESYTYLEIITEETIEIYHNRERVARYDNPHGFVPVFPAYAVKGTNTMFATVRWDAIRTKIDEINSVASVLNDSARKALNAYLVTVGMELDPDDESLSEDRDNRDELSTFGIPDGGNAFMLAPNVPIEPSITNLKAQLEEVKDDLPELYLYRMFDKTQEAPSGVALRQIYDLAALRLETAMGGYDAPFVKAVAAALSMCANRRIPGFAGIVNPMDRYTNYDIVVKKRPVVYDGLTKFQKITLLQSASAPKSGLWDEMDVPPETQADWKTELKREADEAAQRQAVNPNDNPNNPSGGSSGVTEGEPTPNGQQQ